MTVEVDCAGQVDAEVQDYVGEEDNISWVTDNLAGDSGIRPYKTSIQEVGYVFLIPCGENCRLELGILALPSRFGSARTC